MPLLMLIWAITWGVIWFLLCFVFGTVYARYRVGEQPVPPILSGGILFFVLIMLLLEKAVFGFPFPVCMAAGLPGMTTGFIVWGAYLSISSPAGQEYASMTEDPETAILRELERERIPGEDYPGVRIFRNYPTEIPPAKDEPK